MVWIFGLMIAALLAKNAKKKKRRLIISMALFWFFGNGFLFHEVSLLYCPKETPINEVQPKKYGVLLAGMLYINKPAMSPHLNLEGDRFYQMLRLYKAGKVQKIVVTGGSGNLLDQSVKEAGYLQDLFADAGVPREDVIVENDSRNTYENALFTAEIIGANQEIILVTGATHMPRSIGCFKKQGFKVTAFPSSPPSNERRFTFTHLLFPKTTVFTYWQALIHEWLGYGAYAVKGYL